MQQESMDNLHVLREIAYRADDSLLDLISQVPPLWSLISPELNNQFFWYRRTSEAFNLPAELEWSKTSKANWHQIYNILASTRQGNPFSRSLLYILELNEYNSIAIQLLLDQGYDPSLDDSFLIIQAARFTSPQVLQLLLNDERMHVELHAGDVLRYAAREGKVDNMKVLLQGKRVLKVIEEDQLVPLEYAFEDAVYINQLAAAKLVLKEMDKRGMRYDTSNTEHELTEQALKISSVEIIDMLIAEDLIDPEYWIEHVIRLDRAEVLQLLIDKPISKYLNLIARMGGSKTMKLVLSDPSLTVDDISEAICL
ncbi:Hypothetical protein POVR2_LOCUS2 [uncultured virus]|nr:Hypothetical protein POVR2_LOCUS2 [uncultured virus]